MLLKAGTLKIAKVSEMEGENSLVSKVTKRKKRIMLIKIFLLKNKLKNVEKHQCTAANLAKNVGNVNECIYCHIVRLC